MPLHSEIIREIEEGPSGPQVGAFFDLDGTLIATFGVRLLREGMRTGLVTASLSVTRCLRRALSERPTELRASSTTRRSSCAATGRRVRRHGRTHLQENLATQITRNHAHSSTRTGAKGTH
jgi:hypothetical protein